MAFATVDCIQQVPLLMAVILASLRNRGISHFVGVGLLVRTHTNYVSERTAHYGRMDPCTNGLADENLDERKVSLVKCVDTAASDNNKYSTIVAQLAVELIR